MSIQNNTKTLRIKSVNGDTSFQDRILQVNSYVRLIFWGGARKKGDNSAFFYASRNVKKDYEGDIFIDNKASSAKDIIKIIEKQKDNTIQSIDFFTHGSAYALYMVRNKRDMTNSSINTDLEKDEIEANNLYTSKTMKFFQSFGGGNDEDVVSSINFKKFTNSAKIEIHGCNSAADTGLGDNIAINLSEALYEAGKLKSVVIAHSTSADPKIKGEKTKISEQDYRFKERVVYNNGKVLFRTKKIGKITASEINKYF